MQQITFDVIEMLPEFEIQLKHSKYAVIDAYKTALNLLCLQTRTVIFAYVEGDKINKRII